MTWRESSKAEWEDSRNRCPTHDGHLCGPCEEMWMGKGLCKKHHVAPPLWRLEAAERAVSENAFDRDEWIRRCREAEDRAARFEADGERLEKTVESLLEVLLGYHLDLHGCDVADCIVVGCRAKAAIAKATGVAS